MLETLLVVTLGALGTIGPFVGIFVADGALFGREPLEDVLTLRALGMCVVMAFALFVAGVAGQVHMFSLEGEGGSPMIKMLWHGEGFGRMAILAGLAVKFPMKHIHMLIGMTLAAAPCRIGAEDKTARGARRHRRQELLGFDMAPRALCGDLLVGPSEGESRLVMVYRFSPIESLRRMTFGAGLFGKIGAELLTVDVGMAALTELSPLLSEVVDVFAVLKRA